MQPVPPREAPPAKFENDRISGSSQVALGFLDALERWAATDTSRSAPALQTALFGWLRAAQAAQPTLALVHQLAARAFEVSSAGVARGASPVELRRAIAESCAAERADLAAQQDAVAKTAVELVTERESWIATLSASGAVTQALLLAHQLGRAPRALVSESRPLFEGRDLARTLGAAGLPAWLVVDAALPMLLSAARMVWLGADAITDRGVINKVGSYALALSAREHSVPVYVLAARRKFLPSATAALQIAELDPGDVWREPPPNVRPRNVCFELVPFELVRGVVVEDAVLGGSEARTVALDRPLPDELARA